MAKGDVIKKQLTNLDLQMKLCYNIFQKLWFQNYENCKPKLWRLQALELLEKNIVDGGKNVFVPHQLPSNCST